MNELNIGKNKIIHLSAEIKKSDKIILLPFCNNTLAYKILSINLKIRFNNIQLSKSKEFFDFIETLNNEGKLIISINAFQSEFHLFNFYDIYSTGNLAYNFNPHLVLACSEKFKLGIECNNMPDFILDAYLNVDELGIF